ncbi:alpha/beta hydrolase [Vaginisenegalia massiliensis]|uniref:alpha/beta hydrolase n=1 Tax=Vaginisenegalia massiliensis TaxID=2058294 RepID=UPI000F54252C|nr:alpha/beta hydrolase [Vaginisenegalia massiliensis]
MKRKIGCLLVMGLIVWLGVSYYQENATYIQEPVEKVRSLGFVEKQVSLPDGSKLNYCQGPDSAKPTLLLLHGQGMNWTDYAKVMPDLSQHYQIIALDYYGHGKSSWNPDKYTAKAISADLVYFVKHYLKKPVIIAGHSSGGLIAAYFAAKNPDWVSGLILEDTPFFSTEEGKKEHTFAYQYDFKMYHDFLNQSQEKDYLAYSLKRSYFKDWFPEWLWQKMVKDALAYKKQHPQRPIQLTYLPPAINRMFEAVSYPFDYAFGEAFYNQSWFEDYNQRQILSSIKAKTVFIKAKSKYEKGLLLGALSDKQAQEVMECLPQDASLIQVNTQDHDIHWTKPNQYVQIIKDFYSSKLKNNEKATKVMNVS